MKHKIGITEAGDAGLDRSWASKLDTVDGAIAITKNAALDFRAIAATNRDKLIVHITCAGYGGTIVEPYVPPMQEQLSNALDLVRRGFPMPKMVIRVDLIIPTAKGLATAAKVIEVFMCEGFSRFRVSILDMYPHVQERFRSAGLPIPYSWAPSKEQLAATDKMLANMKEKWVSLGHPADILRVESCAEPGLKETIQCGCISAYDLELLGLDPSAVDSTGPQRTHCMCYSGKTELLGKKKRCPHGCLYCYWKN